jgi:hypothetical protein
MPEEKQDQKKDEGLPFFNPALTFINQAIKAVPAVKWALGVGGIVTVIVVVKGFKIDLFVAALGTVVMLMLMTALVVFAKFAEDENSALHAQAPLFAKFAIVLSMGTALALFLSVFADWPLRLRDRIQTPDAPFKPIDRIPLPPGLEWPIGYWKGIGYLKDPETTKCISETTLTVVKGENGMMGTFSSHFVHQVEGRSICDPAVSLPEGYYDVAFSNGFAKPIGIITLTCHKRPCKPEKLSVTISKSDTSFDEREDRLDIHSDEYQFAAELERH